MKPSTPTAIRHMKPDDINFLVDASIPYGKLMFSDLGKVDFLDGPAAGIPHALLAGADVLAVASSIRVDAGLLSRCGRLRVLATPVVGTDHVDAGAVGDLATRLGHTVAVVNAPGSTAQAVADWTIGAILAALGRIPESVAIVGFGNCGRAVAERLKMLAVPFVICDPLLASNPERVDNLPLADLEDVEVVTFHVPYTTAAQSPFPTADMIDAGFTRRFSARGGKLIVNCSRGGILDETIFTGVDEIEPGVAESGTAALMNSPGPILTGPAAGLLFALDVFRGEPSPSRQTVAAAAIATPHVAGNGHLGRLRAAQMVRAETCRILGLADRGITPPDALLALRPTLDCAPASLRTSDGFTSFATRLARLCGVELSERFRNSFTSACDADLSRTFREIRELGMRVEPDWNVAGACQCTESPAPSRARD